MEYPREPQIYQREGIVVQGGTTQEDTLQSIDSTLKRIEKILIERNLSYILDGQETFRQKSTRNSKESIGDGKRKSKQIKDAMAEGKG